jgi:hypothetical protein
VELAEIDKDDQKKYNVRNGLKVTKLYDGKTEYTVQEGFIITVNRIKVTTVQSFTETVQAQEG